MMPVVRALAIILVFVTACGSKATGPAAGQPAVATVFPSARFVPAQPTYVVSARSFGHAQAAFRDVIDVLGMMVGGETAEASAHFKQVLGVDPLSAEAVAGIGVDLEGSMVLFSEKTNPTFVVHLDSPEATAAFFDQQRERGLRTQSVVVAGTEVFTAQIMSDLHISWAVDQDWLWVHFAVGAPDGAEWFEHSKQPAGTAWVDRWKWAQGLAAQASAVTGYIDPQSLLAQHMKQAAAAADCVGTLGAIQRIGVSFDADGKRMGARLAFLLGDASGDLAARLLRTPPGWQAASANAPIAAQWNLDLYAAATFAQTCMVKQVDDGSGTVTQTGDHPNLVGQLDIYGVRAGRAFVHALDPDEKEGTGAISLELAHGKFFRAQLDQIPRRSMFEKSRQFGIYKGTHISVPFVGSGDYVLDDKIAIAAMGEGLLARIGTGSPAGQPPILSIDLRPPGMPAGVWEFLLAQLEMPNPRRFAQRLQTWSELHVGARLEGESLVIEASGTRR